MYRKEHLVEFKFKTLQGAYATDLDGKNNNNI